MEKCLAHKRTHTSTHIHTRTHTHTHECTHTHTHTGARIHTSTHIRTYSQVRYDAEGSDGYDMLAAVLSHNAGTAA